MGERRRVRATPHYGACPQHVTVMGFTGRLVLLAVTLAAALALLARCASGIFFSYVWTKGARSLSTTAHPAAFHCCAMGEHYGRAVPMVLACSGGPDDVVDGVVFAAFGLAAAVTGMCGEYHAGTWEGVANVTTSVAAACMGRPRCELEVSPEAFGVDPAPNRTKVLRVQWSCAEDPDRRERHVAALGRAWAGRQNHGGAVEEGTAQAQAKVGSGLALPSFPLRTQGPDIVDAGGRRVKLAAVNWAGGENLNYAVDGLDVAPVSAIAKQVAAMGFNAVRLPFSVALARDNPVLASGVVAANPTLRGLRALEVMDEVVDALAAEGVLTVLDNHMTDPDWCCQRADCNGLWRNDESADSETEWLDALSSMAARYASRPSVVAMELRNEPREVCPGKSWHVGPRTCKPESFVDAATIAASAAAVNDTFGSKLSAAEATRDGYDVRRCAWPQWDKGPSELRYKRAMEAGGAAVLAVNPNMLVVVDALYYGRDLTEATGDGLIALPGEGGRLVYAVHDYSWYVTDEEAASYEAWAAARTEAWGRLVGPKGTGPPVWVSEFGINHWNLDKAEGHASSSEKPLKDEPTWWSWFSKYASPGGLRADGLDFAYWQLGGVQVGGTSRQRGAEESYGVMNQCWTGPASAEHLAQVMALGGKR